MSIIDPRIASIKKRMEDFKVFVALMSPKGGVGKTFLAAVTAFLLSNKYDVNVSILDMDLANPTLHIVFGLDLKNVRIEEDKGIKPLKVNEKIELMTLAYFTQDYSTPLRGRDVENVIKEILSVTRWSGNVLIIDMPPGFSDSHLEFFRLFNLSKTLITIISTPHIMSLRSVEKYAKTLLLEKLPLIGILGNMCRNEHDFEKICKTSTELELECLGCIPYIDNVENFFGSQLEKIGGIAEPILRKMLQKIVSRLSKNGKEA
ncbi:P-loop NTPase [Ignisphaera sp. 4213-co]|uniref:P-loop NTPase n=1 Tax=Ignisphaera cupida TaxID=3050454 RepID=A0ABD4Z844_9CREN|nr:P-loop NTPase [Ignisphaera sp. 4213-co]MDK6029098.1 P-loop NTPase [Ignisphaera sp. 4213-co]